MEFFLCDSISGHSEGQANKLCSFVNNRYSDLTFRTGGGNPKSFALEKGKLKDCFSKFPTGLAQEIYK